MHVSGRPNHIKGGSTKSFKGISGLLRLTFPHAEGVLLLRLPFGGVSFRGFDNFTVAEDLGVETGSFELIYTVSIFSRDVQVVTDDALLDQGLNYAVVPSVDHLVDSILLREDVADEGRSHCDVVN